MLTAALPAIAAETPAADTGVSEVVVTGVRGQPRTIVDSPTPIDVIGAQDLNDSGRAGMLQALETLVPSFNLPARAGGGISTVISTGGLRGLNPDQMLVLVDGKRRHKTALINSVSSLYNGAVPSDLDLIPVSAIDHIEVLRDGAAAQYGSDAIAGVINVILKDSPGGSVSATSGANMDQQDGLLAQTSSNYGFKYGDSGMFNLSFTTKDQELSNRAIPVAPSIQIYPKIGGKPDPREATVNRLVTYNYGVLPQRGGDLGYNTRYDIGEVQIYSFGTVAKRDTELPFTFRTPNNVNTLPQIYPEGFRPVLDIEEWDYEAAIGARGTWSDWSWDISSTFGDDHARESATQTLNPTLGPTSPTNFYVGTLESSEWVNSIDLTRDFKLGNYGDAQVSFGAQHRLERYQISAGDAAGYVAGSYVIPGGQPFAGQFPAPGAQATPSIQPADASTSSRNNYAVYFETDYNPTKSLFLGGAVRYEDYDDSAGSKVVGKVDGRYEVNDWLSFRAAASTGFRAPALAQEHWSSTASQFQLVGSTLNLLSIKTLPVSSPAAIALGAQPLKPETSKNGSFGATLSPTPNLVITADAYRVDVDDRIALTSTLTGAAVSKILIAAGQSGLLSAQYYTNAINTSTTGTDLVATWRQDLDSYGKLRLNAGFNYNSTNITHINANPPQLSALGPNFVLFDRLSQSYLTTALPKTKVTLGAVWNWQDVTVTLRETRYGDYAVLQDVLSNDRNFNAKWITDLEMAYQVTENVSVAAGASNLFNIYPTANGIFNTATGTGQYPSTSPFGFTGGSYYGRVRYEF